MDELKAELLDAGSFTAREAEIARLMAEGLSDKDIARVLAISIKTVATHSANFYEKLGVRNRSINTRCTAILTMVARGMVRLSIKSIVVILIFNSAQIDSSALRIKGARSGSSVSRLRRTDEA